jgi:hypothetical protein
MQIEVNIESGTYLFVAVPKQIIDYGKIGKNLFFGIGFPYSEKTVKIEYDFNIIGLISQITEEQAENICEFIKDKGFEDYQEKNAVCLFVLDSFQSLLKANNIYTVNPYGSEKPETNSDIWAIRDNYTRYGVIWQEAQKTVSEEWLIIKIIK